MHSRIVNLHDYEGNTQRGEKSAESTLHKISVKIFCTNFDRIILVVHILLHRCLHCQTLKYIHLFSLLQRIPREMCSAKRDFFKLSTITLQCNFD